MKKLLFLLVALVATSTAWAEDTYVVAGVEALCGSNWNGTDTNNQMTLQGSTYVKTYTSVAVGSYQFKVVKNGTNWIGDASGNNVQFVVNTVCDVNIYFNPTNNDITVDGTGVGKKEFVVNKVIAVGNGSGNWLSNVSWDPASSANEMTKVSDLVYEISYNNVPVGSDYQVKFAINGSWGDSFGGTYAGNGVEGDAVYDGGNIYVNVEKAGTVVLKLDLSNFNYDTKQGAKFTITVPQVEEPEETTYFIKHPWDGGDWYWKELIEVEDGIWTLKGENNTFATATYRGVGCDLNTESSDTGSTWFDIPTADNDYKKMKCVFNPQSGDNCYFTLKLPKTSNTMLKDAGEPEIIISKIPANNDKNDKYVIKHQWYENNNFWRGFTGPDNKGCYVTNGPYKSGETIWMNIRNQDEGEVEVTPIITPEVQAKIDGADPSDEYGGRVSCNYTFNPYTSELTLTLYNNGMITGVEDINGAVKGVKAYKVIENGQVIIVKGDARFNIMGQPIR